jgi:hypothetical protein
MRGGILACDCLSLSSPELDPWRGSGTGRSDEARHFFFSIGGEETRSGQIREAKEE